ncbi:MAG: hypothetical protein Q7J80_13640 [Anaerolineales bacterium]|nr:hypothetical protein [Anaerolineales bacterium]
MNNTWKWILGTVLVLGLVAVPFFWNASAPYGQYPMMGTGYGWQSPMMYGGYGMMGFMGLFMWLAGLGFLVLIGLGIAWLVKELNAVKP